MAGDAPGRTLARNNHRFLGWRGNLTSFLLRTRICSL